MHRMITRGLGAAGLALAMVAGTASAATVGKPAPDFTVTTFNYKTITAAQLRGKVVVLNYWATWCAPCRAELLSFYHYVKTHPNPDLEIIEVSEDEVPTDVYRQLSAAVPFPFARKLGPGFGKIDGAIPTNYVIDRAGVVRYAQAGAFDEASFDEVVAPLLAEGAAPAAPAPAVAASMTTSSAAKPTP
jgi:cytochrome c biogenesis protein CcmG, thiol:disulfide interchange protein DsbE